MQAVAADDPFGSRSYVLIEETLETSFIDADDFDEVVDGHDLWGVEDAVDELSGLLGLFVEL